MAFSLSNINPANLSESDLKDALVLCLNLIDSLKHELEASNVLIQNLKDEINRLKGEHGKPIFKAAKKGGDVSSSAVVVQQPIVWKKKEKKAFLAIDKKVICVVDKAKLPSDAVFKGYKSVIQQDIVFTRQNTEYLMEVWYSSSEQKSYQGQASEQGYEGYFGNALKSFCMVMHHDMDLSHSKLQRMFNYLGIELSSGSLQNILVEKPASWLTEKQDILKNGLLGKYVQTDTTGAKVGGKLHRTHLICSDDFAVFSTLQSKSRRNLLYALQGEPQSGLMMAYNPTTVDYLQHFHLSKAFQSQLQSIFEHLSPLSELEFQQIIHQQIPTLAAKPIVFGQVCDSFALGYYQHLTANRQDVPISVLISDAAPEYQLIAPNHGLCWIHDARAYNKLNPFFDYHKQLLTDFKAQYWAFYKTLLQYKEKPTPEAKEIIVQKFETLFVANTPYDELNKAIGRTIADKDRLLTVLDFPFIPLHNNAAELAARHQVRKRDICLHTITKMGTQIQDAFMSIIYTCNLLKVNAFDYIYQRLSGSNEFYLPDLVKIKANSPTTNSS
jgi:hypothetical protein